MNNEPFYKNLRYKIALALDESYKEWITSIRAEISLREIDIDDVAPSRGMQRWLDRIGNVHRAGRFW